jgi:hypothetical protein
MGLLARPCGSDTLPVLMLGPPTEVEAGGAGLPAWVHIHMSCNRRNGEERDECGGLAAIEQGE